MFNPHKNSYLQLQVAIEPRVINKAVDEAMLHGLNMRTEIPAAQRMESMQPSLYAPCVDITRAKVGYGRIGLRLLVRQLHDKDHLTQLRALHSVMDRMQISEEALFLLDLHVAHRLADLLCNRDPVIREKTCMTLTHIADYYQGRRQILRVSNLINDLMWLCLRDKREIRYAAAMTIRTIAADRFGCEVICQHDTIVENLLKIVKNDFVGIIIIHLKTLENLIEWDAERPLKANAFQIMLTLMENKDTRIVQGAMNCMAQLLKNKIGKKLADNYDMVFRLKEYLTMNEEVIISTVQLLKVSTLTTRSKFRTKECCYELTEKLVNLCYSPNKPVLQLATMQVLINLCDNPDIRNHILHFYADKIKNIKIRSDEEWDGTTETTAYGMETGHFYRSMCIEPTETVRNDLGDSAKAINVHSYLQTVQDCKQRLLKAIHFKPYRD